MNAKLAWGFAATGLFMLVVGCTQGTGLIRGQSPTEYAAGSCPACESGQGCRTHGFVDDDDGCGIFGCSPGAGGGAYIGNGGCEGDGCGVAYVDDDDGDGNGGHHPTHYHWFSYEQPRNLVYPPGTQPGLGGQPGGQFGGQAAVIQYPYYTVKGPSDFFMK